MKATAVPLSVLFLATFRHLTNGFVANTAKTTTARLGTTKFDVGKREINSKINFQGNGFPRQRGIDFSRFQMRSSASVGSASATSSTLVDTSWGLPTGMNIQTKLVNSTSEREIMNVATLRNNCTSPKQMIQLQVQKRESIDKTQSMLNGLGVGGGVGALTGIATYAQTTDVADATQTGGIMALVLGGVLGINNAMGNRFYVMTEAEAINRLKVDYVASLLTQQDIGFVAYLNPFTTNADGYRNTVDATTMLSDTYASCEGLVGCVDCEYRSLDGPHSDYSVGGDDAPATAFHVKNMFVDPLTRRKGVARMLLQKVEAYARESPKNVTYLTL
jgi:GNAT superfamily N-acetyltransferase